MMLLQGRPPVFSNCPLLPTNSDAKLRERVHTPLQAHLQEAALQCWVLRHCIFESSQQLGACWLNLMEATCSRTGGTYESVRLLVMSLMLC